MLRRAVRARREVADESAVSRAIRPLYLCSRSLMGARWARLVVAPPTWSGADVRETVVRRWRARYGDPGCVHSWWCPVPEPMVFRRVARVSFAYLMSLQRARRALLGSG